MSVLFIFCQQSHSSVSKTKYFVPVICQPSFVNCMMNMIFSFTFVWDKQTFYRGINHPSVIVPGGMKKFNYSASKHQASYFLWICRHHFQHGLFSDFAPFKSLFVRWIPSLCQNVNSSAFISFCSRGQSCGKPNLASSVDEWLLCWCGQKNLSLFCVLVHNDTVTNPTVHMLFLIHLWTLRVWPREINLQRTIPKISKLKKEK